MIFVDKTFYGGFVEALREGYRQGWYQFNPDELMILVDTEEEALAAAEQIMIEVKNNPASRPALMPFDIRQDMASLEGNMNEVRGLGPGIPTVGVFGSKAVTEDSVDFGTIKAVSQSLSALGYSMISRGDNGISQAVHDGFIPSNGNRHIMTFRNGGEAGGVHVDSNGVKETIYIDSRHAFEQKVVLLKAAKNGLIVSMGGRGTMDLLFEVLTLIQTGKIKGRPVVLVGAAKWLKLFRWIAGQFVTNGTINKQDLDLVRFADTPQEIVDAILRAAAAKANLPSGLLFKDKTSSSPVKDIEEIRAKIFKEFNRSPFMTNHILDKMWNLYTSGG